MPVQQRRNYLGANLLVILALLILGALPSWSSAEVRATIPVVVSALVITVLIPFYWALSDNLIKISKGDLADEDCYWFV
jgi:hypothetical protein